MTSTRSRSHLRRSAPPAPDVDPCCALTVVMRLGYCPHLPRPSGRARALLLALGICRSETQIATPPWWHSRPPATQLVGQEDVSFSSEQPLMVDEITELLLPMTLCPALREPEGRRLERSTVLRWCHHLARSARSSRRSARRGGLSHRTSLFRVDAAEADPSIRWGFTPRH